MWKAAKYNLPSRSSFYYKDLTSEMQQMLSTYVDTEAAGLPLLFFTKPTKEWTLICVKKVICNNNQKVFAIDIADIKGMRASVFGNTSDSEERLKIVRSVGKAEWHELDLVDQLGNTYVLHADKGADLFALWNILLMAKRLYQLP